MGTIKKFCISLITLLFICFATSEECINCVPIEECEEFGNINEQEQEAWTLQYPCPNDSEKDEGDYVCCPSALNAFYYRQYPKISSPPRSEPDSCGREATKTGRIDLPDTPIRGPPSNNWIYAPFNVRPMENPDEINNDNKPPEKRITGGSETDFEQYPWTVLLRKEVSFFAKELSFFHCGGSLISDRHVLTAGHCVYSSSEGIAKLEVVLADYNRNSYPMDCKIVFGQGKKCIENVVMQSENVILHPEYNGHTLENDIALIKLIGNAPYTNYIRPICLPSINVDTSDNINLPLGIAGWGNNGPFSSYIKQSTVVNLVPHKKCSRSYPYLSRGQMCAVGYNGEDTCPGDSGGPLMVVNNGRFELVGVVSGKRRDVPCGSPVPSLYTNVYQYLNWIHSNLHN